jgi:hypothetical protein
MNSTDYFDVIRPFGAGYFLTLIKGIFKLDFFLNFYLV